MALPKIDTFEKDIADEIIKKEETTGGVLPLGVQPETIPDKNSHSTILIISVSILLLCGIISIVVFLYIQSTSNKNKTPPLKVEVTKTPLGPTYETIQLKDVSPMLDAAIGGFITNIQKREDGYSMNVSSYSSVFSYMLRNESMYAETVASSLSSPLDTSTTTEPYKFTDITVSNQNMRVGTSGSSTIIYAFINTDTLLFSSSTEGIMSLRGAILR